jgi:hypothetical protein
MSARLKDERKVHKTSFGKTNDEKRALGRPRRRQKDNIKI